MSNNYTDREMLARIERLESQVEGQRDLIMALIRGETISLAEDPKPRRLIPDPPPRLNMPRNAAAWDALYSQMSAEDRRSDIQEYFIEALESANGPADVIYYWDDILRFMRLEGIGRPLNTYASKNLPSLFEEYGWSVTTLRNVRHERQYVPPNSKFINYDEYDRARAYYEHGARPNYNKYDPAREYSN